jgi:NAD(P)-dependent dehydrogenase (short-subunit alcohol dehydrogenase family)
MPNALFSVEHQTVLVSGGSRGIGRAIAAGFVERGATVIITGRSEATLNEAMQEIAPVDGKLHTRLCDVAQLDELRALTSSVIDDFGHIDTLINVAGVNRRKPTLEVTEDDYDFIMNINLKGAYFLSQEVGRHMVQRRSGSQINIASLNSDRPLMNVLPYAMSKAAMASMTEGLATEWGPAGVRVNAIAPGFILTDLTRKLWTLPEMQAWGQANTPQQRLGTPEDMVGTALFLASEASAFMTGQVLYVDGGFTAGRTWPIPIGGGQ